MDITFVPIDSLKLDPANARRHGTRSIEEIKESLRRFGQLKPIIVDSQGVVRAGNGTLTAARELGWAQIAVHTPDLTEAKFKAYALADNRTAEHSDWDEAILAGCLSDPDLGNVGWDQDEIQKLIEKATGGPAGKPEKQKPLKLTADQYVVVRQAITTLRERESDPAMSDGRALELICADWAIAN